MKVKEHYDSIQTATSALMGAIDTLNCVADYLKELTEGQKPAEAPKTVSPVQVEQKSEPKALSLDELRSVLIPLINESDANGQIIQDTLKAYKATRVSELPENKRQAFLDEVKSKCQDSIPF